MVFTKIDKIDTLKLKSNIKIYLQKMLKDWESLPQHFITSSHTGEGRDEILNFINEINFKNKL